MTSNPILEGVELREAYARVREVLERAIVVRNGTAITLTFRDIDDTDAAIIALKATPLIGLSQGEGETGWVIEHGSMERPMYWTGVWGRWSGDHKEACRFARREDAHKVSLSLGDMPNDPPHKIAEHKWMPL